MGKSRRRESGRMPARDIKPCGEQILPRDNQRQPPTSRPTDKLLQEGLGRDTGKAAPIDLRLTS